MIASTPRPDLAHAWRYVVTTPHASGPATNSSRRCPRCQAEYAAIRDARRRGDFRAESHHATALTAHWKAAHQVVQR
ncbi:hypothetical protein I5Q34_04355 [Streptomyces sp. AV19]|uniref:hypothetical protein n=1 Tax=Streptomyces sp. AV19 TaxID=2793068 RepID=UPI0018FEB4ED|nr:hypothetical protein [Streptomyces sp. AV19]MBH1933528.1 hypothetical protein [Streptomyces sp. AV19]MDG4532182.1 hypothetical protein [Streptomyces sp. AV19]